MEWRLLGPEDGPGAWQMAVDVALLESIRAGVSGPVVRFYRWTPPCVTLGKFQPVAANVRLDACRQLGIEVARRPTGGRAILHAHEVTFSFLVAERALPAAGTSIMESYRVFGAAISAGLQGMGLPVELVDRQAAIRNGDPSAVGSVGNPACFAAKARCDLMIDGRKLIGSAQLRRDSVILQQNSLPLTIDFAQWGEVFWRSDWEQVAAQGAVGLWQVAGHPVPYEAVMAAVCTGLVQCLGARLVPGALTMVEAARASALVAEHRLAG
jgi:lipoate-protein ligase A